MGQLPTCENVHQNMETLQDGVVRHARIITEIATLTHKELVAYIDEINSLSEKCMDAEGKQLSFYIRKGSDSGLLWKNSVRIVCIRYEPETKVIVPVKYMTLNQFLRVYRSLNMQFKAAECSGTDQGEEAAACTNTFNSSFLMKEFDLVVGSSSECCICFERPHEVMLPCFHSFCQACIKNWNSSHKTCPICREIMGSDKDSWVIFDVPSGFEIEKDLVTSVMDIVKEETSEKD